MCYQNADVDECDQQLAPCDQLCSNTDGSFICSCNDGYYLGDDMLTCYGKPACTHNAASYKSYVQCLATELIINTYIAI